MKKCNVFFLAENYQIRKFLMQRYEQLHKEFNHTPIQGTSISAMLAISKELRYREWSSAVVFITFLYSIKCITIDRK